MTAGDVPRAFSKLRHVSSSCGYSWRCGRQGQSLDRGGTASKSQLRCPYGPRERIEYCLLCRRLRTIVAIQTHRALDWARKRRQGRGAASLTGPLDAGSIGRRTEASRTPASREPLCRLGYRRPNPVSASETPPFSVTDGCPYRIDMGKGGGQHVRVVRNGPKATMDTERPVVYKLAFSMTAPVPGGARDGAGDGVCEGWIWLLLGSRLCPLARNSVKVDTAQPRPEGSLMDAVGPERRCGTTSSRAVGCESSDGSLVVDGGGREAVMQPAGVGAETGGGNGKTDQGRIPPQHRHGGSVAQRERTAGRLAAGRNLDTAVDRVSEVLCCSQGHAGESSNPRMPTQVQAGGFYLFGQKTGPSAWGNHRRDGWKGKEWVAVESLASMRILAAEMGRTHMDVCPTSVCASAHSPVQGHLGLGPDMMVFRW